MCAASANKYINVSAELTSVGSLVGFSTLISCWLQALSASKSDVSSMFFLYIIAVQPLITI
ncbi:hypothetical protein PA7559_05610 [Pseudoalteromonas distincta]